MNLSKNDCKLIEETTQMIINGTLKIPTQPFTWDILTSIQYFSVPKEKLKDDITDAEHKDYEKGMRLKLVYKAVKEAWYKFMPVVNTPNMFGENNKNWLAAWHNFVVYQLYV